MIIPGNPKYNISTAGEVRLTSTGEVIPRYTNRHGRLSVKIRGKSHKPSSHPIDRLLLTTFKSPPIGHDPDFLSVKYIDGDFENVVIDNLDWDTTWHYPNPEIGFEFGRTGWVSVFGQTKLQIRLFDDQVLVRCSKSLKEYDISEDIGGYQVIRPAWSNKDLRLHRLVALTFLPHPTDTDHLTVNHKDSNKKNNRPINLEWVTYSKNNYHAFDEGIRSDAVRRVRTLNLSTGIETTFSGYHDVGRYLGVSASSIHQVLERRKRDGIPYRDHLLKYESDHRSWVELRSSGSRSDLTLPEKIARKNLDTGEVRIYTNHREIFREENIREFTLLRLVKSKIPIPWRRRCFVAYHDDAEPMFPNYPKEIIDVYEKTSVSDRPIRVTDINSGKIEYHTGVTRWCDEDRSSRCDPAVLSRYLNKSLVFPFVWRNWKFEYIDLNEY